MTQHVPAPETVASAGEPSGETEANIRRRLGNWTTSTASSATLATAPFAAADGVIGTVPLDTAGDHNSNTVELSSASPGLSELPMTMDLQQAVPLNATAPMQTPHTQPFESLNPAIRARQDAQAAKTVSYHTAELNDEIAVTAPISAQTAPIETGMLAAPLSAPTVPIGTGTLAAPNSDATVPIGSGMLNALVSDATVPFGSGMLTAPIADATVPIGSGMLTTPISDATVPIGSGMLTAPISDATVPIGTGMLTAPINTDVSNPVEQAGLPDTSGISYTGIMGEETGSLAPARNSGLPNAADPTATMQLPVQNAQVSPELQAEIEELRNKVEANPDDIDCVLELALALNDAGDRAEAHEIMLNMVALYEAQGDFEQASKIRLMIGDAGTAQIAPDHGATQPMLRQTTDSLKPRTGTLNLRSVPASRDGRIAQRQKTDSRERAVFPSRDVTFTEVLPQIERLNPIASQFFALAEADRLAGKFRSALDNLQMAVAQDPSVPTLFLRLAEVQLRLGYRRKALDSIDQLQQFENLFRSGVPDWEFARLRLHAESFELVKVQRLVDTMIEDGHADVAAPYAARLVEHLMLDERVEDANEYADRICGLAPGDTRSTLEAAILAIKVGDRGRAIDRWEFALRNGADPVVGKASMAALVADSNESDHWRLIAEVLPAHRIAQDTLLADAYRRTAEALGLNSIHKGTISLFIAAPPTSSDRTGLASAAGDRTGSPVGRAAAAAALAHILQSADRGDEYLASIRTTLTLFTDERIPENINWNALLGFTPTVDEMSFELGQELMKAGDASGAVDVLKQGHALNKAQTRLTLALADAFARTNQLGSALTKLDELAMSHRTEGRLDEMATVLRQMSQLAPANIKVKSRLVDAYLQRGFVAEARAELIQRADLEERAGMLKEAVISLQRAADLSWNLGFPQEAFNLYDKILGLDPEDVANRSALVNLYLQVGRLSDAAEHQRAVVDLALTHGRKHEAIAALHQVIGLTPDDMTAYYQLAELLSSMGEYQQAEKVYRRIVLMNPDDAIAQAKATSMAALKEQRSGG